MNNILEQYFTAFLHPLQLQRFYREVRQEKSTPSPRRLFEIVTEVYDEDREEDASEQEEERFGVNFLESLSISWMMYLFKAAYGVLSLYLSYQLYLAYDVEASFLSQLKFNSQRVLLFIILLKVVLFPLSFWVYTKFWVNIIKLFAGLFEVKGDVEKISNQIVNNSMTTHTFLIVPLVGEILSHVAGIIYLFGGLRKNMELSITQALSVLIFPLFLIFLLFLMTALLFGLTLMSL
jgi:hypothetical protein